MKTIFKTILASFLLFNLSAQAQQKVALHHNGITTIFGGSDPFTDAYNASANGDTLYLPGGTIPYPATINKSLVIIGAGHYPDSTMATGKTVLTGNLTISQDADNLWLEGFELTGSILFTNNHKVDSVTIKRCKFNAIDYYGIGTTPCLNNNLLENIITGSVTLTNATSSMLSNNVINGQIANANDIGISNNILLFNSSATGNPAYVTFNNVDNCFVTNNIVFRTSGGGNWVHYGSELSTFSNNIFGVIPNPGTSTFINNYNSVVLSTVFVNQTGNVFDYGHNYHLVNPTTYLGIDNTQVGIYGGLFPIKEGAVPINPHIQSKNISTQTDNNGDLNIQIEVGAQNN
jgi:hypothetical protein